MLEPPRVGLGVRERELVRHSDPAGRFGVVHRCVGYVSSSTLVRRLVVPAYGAVASGSIGLARYYAPVRHSDLVPAPPPSDPAPRSHSDSYW